MCETRLSEGVIPNDKPTVPIAETVSKMQAPIGSPSAMLITAAPIIDRIRYINKSVAAFLIVSSSILLPNSCALFFLRKTEKAPEKRTAIVVVFMPPAVDPGDPPISIKTISSTLPVPDREEKDAVLKPAVLGVIA